MTTTASLTYLVAVIGQAKLVGFVDSVITHMPKKKSSMPKTVATCMAARNGSTKKLQIWIV